MKALRLVSASLLLVVALVAPAAAEGEKAKASKSMTLLDDVAFEGGTELAASGKYLYAGHLNGKDNRGQDPEKGGVLIFELDKAGVPTQVGEFKCPGDDNDVEVIKPGLIAVGHHKATCNPAEDSSVGNAGMYLLDVRNPKSPVQVGSINLPSGMQSHTIKPYPGQPFVYVNPGGLPSNGRMQTHIVDISNPAKPKLASTFFAPGIPSGCHDFSFHISKGSKLGFCAGYGAFSIWDVSDPTEPQVISNTTNPQIEFNHYAVPSPDGKLLAIDDEAFAFHECNSGSSPTGRVWFYDITDPSAPKAAGSMAPPRGGDGGLGVGHYLGWVPSWCLSHGLDWAPGTHTAAVTWFTGGISLVDVSLKGDIKEVGYYQAANSATYSALWHDGRLYTNDMWRGVDAFAVNL